MVTAAYQTAHTAVVDRYGRIAPQKLLFVGGKHPRKGQDYVGSSRNWSKKHKRQKGLGTPPFLWVSAMRQEKEEVVAESRGQAQLVVIVSRRKLDCVAPSLKPCRQATRRVESFSSGGFLQMRSDSCCLIPKKEDGVRVAR